MADCVPAVIRIGGQLPPSLFPVLLDCLAGEGLTVLDDGRDLDIDTIPTAGPIEFSEEEVSWGCFKLLEQFCFDQQLPFTRWSGSAPGSFAAERVVFTGEGLMTSFEANDDDGVVLTHERAQALGTFEEIQAYFLRAEFKVPPLTLVNEETAHG